MSFVGRVVLSFLQSELGFSIKHKPFSDLVSLAEPLASDIMCYSLQFVRRDLLILMKWAESP